MSEETDYFFSQDGLRLSYRMWTPSAPEKILCIIHGLGEHSGRYEHVAAHLNNQNIGVFALDLRGHGLSAGKRGHAKRYDLLLSDVEELLKIARSEFTEIPLFLMGHSLGGNIVASYIQQMNINELEGYILSAPWFGLAFQPPIWKLRVGRLLVKMWPSLTQPNELDTATLSRIPEVVKAYESDPLVHDRISAGLYSAISGAAKRNLEKIDPVKLPGLIYHGNTDRLIDWRQSELYAGQVNAEWHELKGVYHEPHNDLENEKVLKLISGWLAKQRSEMKLS